MLPNFCEISVALGINAVDCVTLGGVYRVLPLTLKGGTEYQHYDFIEWARSVWDGVTGFPWQRDGRAGDTLDYLHNLLTRPNAKCGPCINSFPVKWNKEGVASGGKGWIIRGVDTDSRLLHFHLTSLGALTHGLSTLLLDLLNIDCKLMFSIFRIFSPQNFGWNYFFYTS